MIIGIAGNTKKPRVREAILHLTAYLDGLGVPLVIDRELAGFPGLGPDRRFVPLEEIGGHCDLLAAFGGDGTLLATASKAGASGTPILGVNLGGLGFLAEVPLNEMEETFDDLLAGRYALIERMVLKVSVEHDHQSRCYHALNDLVVEKGSVPRLILVEVNVDGTYLNTYRCDGVIIATPTGSTAYSLSAGGPLLMPTMEAIVVTPICPHSLTVRPVVLSEQCHLELRLVDHAHVAQINIDGQNRCSLRSADRIRIERGDYKIKWVDTGKRDFFNVLRTKLNWGIDLTALKSPERGAPA
ncbi:MAG TPA: NAD(+)/NADH kinase [bacterium]|nr:NAD(+)/NADH kinase [bacterium]HPR88582.1 NAD(+)/NADH kinase [bacterium]